MSNATARKPGRRKSRVSLTGMRFGMISVGEMIGLYSGGRAVKYNIRCDCGVSKAMWGHVILRSRTQSCGCRAGAAISAANSTHGMTKSAEFAIWSSMIARCTRPSAINYAEYGGRVITVCERWLEFENFYSDIGPRPSSKHSLDRFPDNNGNYEPGNCRWATDSEQQRNKRSNVMITVDGVTRPLVARSEVTGIEYSVLHSRYKRGWSPDRMIRTRVTHKRSK